MSHSHVQLQTATPTIPTMMALRQKLPGDPWMYNSAMPWADQCLAVTGHSGILDVTKQQARLLA